MITKELLDYIKLQLEKGTNKEQIKSTLIANGWQAQDIDQAFNSLASPIQPPVSQPMPQQPIARPMPQQIKPQAPAQISPQFQATSTQPSGGNKTLIITASVIIGLLIIGGGVFAYLNYFQSPDKIVRKMTEKLADITSVEYSGEIKIEGNTKNSINTAALLPVPQLTQPASAPSTTQPAQSIKTSNFSTTVNFSGKSDLSKPENPKASLVLDIGANQLSSEGKFSSGITFGLETKIIDKIFYINLTNIPQLGILDLSFIKDRWIKFDPEALVKQFGLENILEQATQKQQEQQLSQEQIDKIRLAIKQNKILKITGKLASENIGGVSTYHYKFTIDKNGLKKLISDISQIIGNQASVNEQAASLDSVLAATEFPEGEIWIGKKDFFLYKISLNLVVKETEETKSSGTASFNLSLKNFNKPAQIDVPDSTTSLEEFIGGLLSSFSASTTPLLTPTSTPVK